jgi:hypothetical protein
VDKVISSSSSLIFTILVRQGPPLTVVSVLVIMTLGAISVLSISPVPNSFVLVHNLTIMSHLGFKVTRTSLFDLSSCLFLSNFNINFPVKISFLINQW